ncbi:hypothetical protein HDA40_008021 [Hamadaea flava]|uniref:Uncharacterized protein n=1 Tax=Hamadaea flava TaxID=1742688 RepID=A0ABV8LX32_9ACTN|nr:hypothetical protein [Hamadaea flava]MCP2329514.1 hypothetical protein [Hamadaea flava]
MMVTRRAGSGDWETWRVGRRRLAFRPYITGFADAPDSSELSLIIVLLQVVPFAVVWLAALAATMAVWPWRALTGRWLVVAYPTASPGKAHRRRVDSAAEAKQLVAQWSEAITSGQLEPRVAAS